MANKLQPIQVVGCCVLTKKEKEMDENKRILIHQMARQLMPVIYAETMRTAKEGALFLNDDWPKGLALDAYKMAEAFAEVSDAWEAKHS
ncbi:hypothetical protein [Psychrobacter sanguinis]|uniref:hypothetical protein n=2 Tax=Psychrobacter sanguinis TaxID=861445 RepID=UPI001918386A|nr:hypothetical protein [Psychrobacter sanguinis]MCC3344562.1 hypothetical protein [Psychrobacter sanguinis]